MKIYTKTGDKGQTSLVGGLRVSKTHPRLEGYGTIDELNSHLGVCLALIHQSKTAKLTKSPLSKILNKVQHRLFNIGSLLACEDNNILVGLPTVNSQDVQWLEQNIDMFTQDLPPLRQFVLPGGSLISAQLHVARTITRRAERHIVSLTEDPPTNPSIVEYINRLSDFLFVAARWSNWAEDVADITWKRDYE